MKKTILILSAVVMTAIMVSSCGGDSNSSKATEKANSDESIEPVNMDSACDYVSEISRILDLMLVKVGNRMIEEIGEESV